MSEVEETAFASELTHGSENVDPLSVSTSALPPDFAFRDPRYAPTEFSLNFPVATVPPLSASSTSTSWSLLTVGLLAATLLRRRSLSRPHN